MRGVALALLGCVLGLSSAWKPAWVAPMAAFRRPGGQASRTRHICHYDQSGSSIPAMRDEMLAVADVHGWVLEIRPLLYIATATTTTTSTPPGSL